MMHLCSVARECATYTEGSDIINDECRWPPRMVERMEAFLALASAKQPAAM